MCDVFQDKYNHGLRVGEARGIEIGEARGEARGACLELIQQITKKVKKDKTLEQTAEDLEQDLEKIKPIWEAVKSEAPDYDEKKILKRLVQEGSKIDK